MSSQDLMQGFVTSTADIARRANEFYQKQMDGFVKPPTGRTAVGSSVPTLSKGLATPATTLPTAPSPTPKTPAETAAANPGSGLFVNPTQEGGGDSSFGGGGKDGSPSLSGVSPSIDGMGSPGTANASMSDHTSNPGGFAPEGQSFGGWAMQSLGNVASVATGGVFGMLSAIATNNPTFNALKNIEGLWDKEASNMAARGLNESIGTPEGRSSLGLGSFNSEQEGRSAVPNTSNAITSPGIYGSIKGTEIDAFGNPTGAGSDRNGSFDGSIDAGALGPGLGTKGDSLNGDTLDGPSSPGSSPGSSTGGNSTGSTNGSNNGSSPSSGGGFGGPSHDGHDGEGPSGGGSSGGSDRVICTYLKSKGVMSWRLWWSDVTYTHGHLSRQTVRGYHWWAIPAVRLMRSGSLPGRLLENVLTPFAMARARELDYQLGGRSKPSLLGKAFRAVVEPTCWVIGAFVGEQDVESLYRKK